MSVRAGIAALTTVAAITAAPAPRIAQVPLRGSVIDESTGAGLAAAIVTLSNTEGHQVDSAVTDERGQFAFERVGPARVRLKASKAGYLSAEFGARQPGRPGRAWTVGAATADPVIALTPAGSISGTVYDADGSPMPGIEVALMRMTHTGEPILTASTPQSTARSDDRGRFRVASLAAGTYVVGASAGIMGAGAAGRVVSQADLQSARNSAAPHRPAQTSTAHRVAYGSTYYPSAESLESAGRVELARSQHRDGIDIHMRRVNVSDLTGIVVGPTGGPLSAALTLFPSRAYVPAPHQRHISNSEAGSLGGAVSVRSDSQGRFTVRDVPAGPHRVVGHGVADGMALWIDAEVSVDPFSSAEIVLRATEGIVIAGVIEPRSASKMPPLPGTRVALVPRAGVAGSVTPSPAMVVSGADGEWTFRASGVAPGEYRLRVDGLPRGWVADSAMLGDADLLDVPTRGSSGSRIERVQIAVTDAPARILGTFSEADGTEPADYFVVLFPASRDLWLPGARRIRAVRPDAFGRYEISPLPSGDYRLAAVWDVAPDEWFDPEFLEQLVPASIPISLADGEQRVQDIRVAGGSPPATRQKRD